MKRVNVLLPAFLVLFFASTAVHAATMTIDILGLDETTPVEGFTIWLDVSDDFTLDSGANLGDAIPEPLNLGWGQDNFDVVGGETLRMGFSDQDNLFLGLSNPLVDGTLLSFDYTGVVEGLALAQIFSGDLVPVDFFAEGTITLSSFTDTNITFLGPGDIGGPVPIPSTVLLLGSGLIGLIGIRRRRG